MDNASSVPRRTLARSGKKVAVTLRVTGHHAERDGYFQSPCLHVGLVCPTARSTSQLDLERLADRLAQEQFFAVDRHGGRGLDAQTDRVSANLDNRHDHLVADHHALTNPAAPAPIATRLYLPLGVGLT